MGQAKFVNGVVINFDNGSNFTEITEIIKMVAKELKDEYYDHEGAYLEKYATQIELFRKENYERSAHQDIGGATRKTKNDI